MSSVLVVPRWSGTATSDWYPWITRALAARVDATVEVVPLRPHPDAPVIEPAVDALAAAVNRAAHPVVLVGHSVGCQVVLRYLGTAPPSDVTAAVMVAGWFEVDETWPTLRPWVDRPHGVRLLPVPTRVLVSTNDPFTADHDTTRTQWEALGALVSVHEGAGHFNAPEQPVVLDVVERALPPA